MSDDSSRSVSGTNLTLISDLYDVALEPAPNPPSEDWPTVVNTDITSDFDATYSSISRVILLFCSTDVFLGCSISRMNSLLSPCEINSAPTYPAPTRANEPIKSMNTAVRLTALWFNAQRNKL